MSQPETVFAYLARGAQTLPRKTALADGNASYDYATYAHAVAALATALAGRAERGAAVAVAMPKCAALPIAYLGAAAAGFVPFPVDFKSRPERWAAAYAGPTPALVLTTAAGTENIELATPEGKAAVVVVDDIIKDRRRDAALPDTRADDVFYINMTSGTGGRPRAAAATHRNIIANATASNAALGLGTDDVTLCTFAAHAHPHETFARALVAGGTAVFVESILPRTILDAVAAFRVTALMGVPPLFRTLLSVAGDYDVAALRLAEAGGMTTPAAVAADFRKTFGIPLIRVWGSAETSGVALVARPDAAEASLGRPIAGYEGRVVADDGADAADGEAGELVLAGPACVRGYWTGGRVASFAEPFVRTGDVVRKEPDGSFTFLDRRQGLMKVAGEKVYAAEIERALLNHPAVAEAAVVAENEDRRGQAPAAFVVPFPHLSLNPAAVIAFAKENLPPIKRPKRVTVVSELPRTGSGKIDKKRLAGRDATELEALAATDDEILILINRRYERLHELGDAFSAEEAERLIGRLVATNAGPLYDETVAEIFRKLNELLGR